MHSLASAFTSGSCREWGLDPGVLPDPAVAFSPRLPGDAQKRRVNYFARRGELLAATRRLIGRGGHFDFTMRSVADEAGCSIQTVYNLFASRADIMAEAVLEYIAAMIVTTGDRSQTDTFFAELSHTYAESARRHTDYMKMATLTYFPPFLHLHDRIEHLSIRMMRERTRNADAPPAADAVDIIPQINWIIAMVMLEWSLGRVAPRDLEGMLVRSVEPLNRLCV